MGSQEPGAPKTRSVWYLIGELSGLAFMMPAAALIGYGLGWLMDGWLHTGRIFQLGFLVLGLIAGLVEVVRVAARLKD